MASGASETPFTWVDDPDRWAEWQLSARWAGPDTGLNLRDALQLLAIRVEYRYGLTGAITARGRSGT